MAAQQHPGIVLPRLVLQALLGGELCQAAGVYRHCCAAAAGATHPLWNSQCWGIQSIC